MSGLPEKARLDQQRRRERLLLAAIDMEQVIAAADAIDSAGENYQLVRALETAIGACYWRPFTANGLVGRLDPRSYAPADSGMAGLHWTLKRLRNEWYVHTEASSGRSAGISWTVDPQDPNAVDVVLSEGWLPFPREQLPQVRALALSQRDRFRQDALEIDQTLQRDAEGTRPS